MGIRFFCPNGHKLNVKEHLAGKAGFCPECGVRLVIPYQSTRRSSKESGGDFAPDTSHQIVEGGSENPKFSLTPSSFFVEEMKSHPSEMQASLPTTISPLLADPTIVWYIQVVNGPQYGPIDGEVVQNWIQENRIGPTMLVWREGWTEWLEAKNVFPELGGSVERFRN